MLKRRRNAALDDWFKRDGRTQKEVAALLGISEAHLCGIRLGETYPSLKVAIRISELTGVPIQQLARQPEAA